MELEANASNISGDETHQCDRYKSRCRRFDFLFLKTGINLAHKMEYLRNALLPRRLTEMYADTKRTYEQIVQNNIINPQISSLHLKLKIQKDRLVAWGLEWADSKADHNDDIDGSLDRAGISDLVASIMSSIRELLDEAERIQPQPGPQPPGAFPLEKAGLSAGTSTQWTPENLARLADIVKDITTSIDTLCDLSKSQQILRQHVISQEEKKPLPSPLGAQSEKALQSRSASEPVLNTSKDASAVQDQSSIIASTRIDPNDLVYPSKPQSPGPLPPSYDLSATDPGNRSFAFLKTSRGPPKTSGDFSRPQDTPVLVDYYSEDGATPRHGPLPSLQRFENLVLALQGFRQQPEHAYTGSLKILGWFADPNNSRYAFVYEIPRPPQLAMPSMIRPFHPPQSLLSYLQHSGDTDSSNVPCLEDRFRLALNLVTNILHIHAKGLTHRNINSNNVVFLSEAAPQSIDSKPWTEGTIRKPFLVSWDQCAEDASISQPETLISSIYRHPGISRGQRSAYRAVHDVYSLGLVLLEVGLWIPLNKLWKTKYTRSDFKSRLQSIYAKRLGGKCGQGYMGAVEHCLRAVENGHSAHNSTRLATQDQQPTIHTDFYWNVLKPLERCCMLDSSDEPRISSTSSAISPRRGSLPSGTNSKSTVEAQDPALEDPREAITDSPLWDALKADSPTDPGVKINVCVWSKKVPAATRSYFDTVMMPKLSRMFAKAINRWESYEIHVCMAGETPETAKPTILMVCRSILRAWKILHHVNEDKRLFDIQVASGQVTRSKRGKKKRTNKTPPLPGQKDGKYPSRFQQKPACGASIGCFVDEQHSEAVTFGGVVLVNGEAHGMSVHHMLEDPDAAIGVGSDDKGVWPPNIASLPDLEDDMTGNFDLLDISDDEFDGLQSSAQDDLNVEEDLNAGDVPGTKPGTGSHIIVTQPALDDVEPEFFPDEDEMSDDHLVIHGLGSIHASSGLRRFTYGEVAHEVDWALFKLHDDRKPAINIVDGGSKHCQKAGNSSASYPCQVVKSEELGDLQVHAFGSTSG